MNRDISYQCTPESKIRSHIWIPGDNMHFHAIPIFPLHCNTWTMHGRTTNFSESVQTTFCGSTQTEMGTRVVEKPMIKQVPRRKETLKLLQKFWVEKSAEIEITQSENGNLANDANSVNSIDSSMEVVCAGSVSQDDSNANLFSAIGKKGSGEITKKTMDHHWKNVIVSIRPQPKIFQKLDQNLGRPILSQNGLLSFQVYL